VALYLKKSTCGACSTYTVETHGGGHTTSHCVTPLFHSRGSSRGSLWFYGYFRRGGLVLRTDERKVYVSIAVNYTGWPKKVSHYRESSSNRIKTRQ